MSDGVFVDPAKEYKELLNNWKYTSYPEGDTLYYVEFLERGGKTTWTLFKRHYVCSEEEWHKIIKDKNYLFMSREVHPWNLGGGEVVSEGLISMNTKGFLKFLVDSLNLKNLSENK